jgi:uncharacterized protein YegL
MKTNWIRSAGAAVGLALLVFLPPEILQAQEAHDNVVIVLDASGSMAGRLAGTSMDKMSAAKKALKEMLNKIPQSTHVGLLVFSAQNLKNDWAYPLGPRNDAELSNAIDLPIAHGGTPLGRYIKIGADRLIEERTKQFGYGTYRLVIVTDGEAEDGQLVDRYTPDVIARGIKVDVIGVAMSETHTLARKVHSYRAANDSASLQRALSEVFAEVADSRTDSTDADVFALLAPLPDKLAAAVIQALSAVDNRPIGAPRVSLPATKPKLINSSPATASPGNGATALSPNQGQRLPPPAQSAPIAVEHARRLFGPSTAVVIFVLVALSILLGRNKRRRS